MSDNAVLEVTLERSGGDPIRFKTTAFLDINAAYRTYDRTVSGNSSICIRDPGGSEFTLVPVRNIIGIRVREIYPEIEREKAATREAEEIKRMDIRDRIGRSR